MALRFLAYLTLDNAIILFPSDFALAPETASTNFHTNRSETTPESKKGNSAIRPQMHAICSLFAAQNSGHFLPR
jgi:hypothetical protein